MTQRLMRVVLVTGDARQGRYVRHNRTHLWINDGRERKLQFAMIDAITEPRLEACLENE